MRNFLKLTFILLLACASKAQTAPVASFVVTSPVLCTGAAINFSSVSTGNPLSYTWSVEPVKGLTAYSNLISHTVSLTFTSTQTYTVYLRVANSVTTSSTFSVITISKMPKASFNASLFDAGYPKNTLVLTNYSSSYLKSEWYFDNNFAQKDSSTNITKTYANGGNYSVMLVAKGTKGCSDSSRYSFTISDVSSLTLPNVFTPNGDDINDVYKPIAVGISKITAFVFNRNDVLVGSWDKVNGFWDGHTPSGETCPEGVYIVVVQAEGYDGKTYKLKSNITLAR